MSFALTVGSDGQAATAQVVWSVDGQTYQFRSDNNFLSWITTIFTIADILSAGGAPDYRLLRPTPATDAVLGNVAGGANALLLATGGGNTAYGFNALVSQTTGIGSSAFGYQALNNNNGGTENTACGYQSLLLNSTGSQNTAVGLSSLLLNLTGSSNTSTGYSAGRNSSTGSFNTAIGSFAGIGATSARNVCVGWQSLTAMTSATNNVGVGYQTGLALTSGGNNTAVGYQALGAGTGVAKSNHTCIGYNSGIAITTGLQNTLVGSGANVDLGARSRCINIGYNTISPAADGSLAIGGSGGDAMGNLNVAAAGVIAAGEYLNIYINGVQRKIQLLLP